MTYFRVQVYYSRELLTELINEFVFCKFSSPADSWFAAAKVEAGEFGVVKGERAVEGQLEVPIWKLVGAETKWTGMIF